MNQFLLYRIVVCSLLLQLPVCVLSMEEDPQVPDAVLSYLGQIRGNIADMEGVHNKKNELSVRQYSFLMREAIEAIKKLSLDLEKLLQLPREDSKDKR